MIKLILSLHPYIYKRNILVCQKCRCSYFERECSVLIIRYGCHIMALKSWTDITFHEDYYYEIYKTNYSHLEWSTYPHVCRQLNMHSKFIKLYLPSFQETIKRALLCYLLRYCVKCKDNSYLKLSFSLPPKMLT